jgi:hypothetical protein
MVETFQGFLLLFQGVSGSFHAYYRAFQGRFNGVSRSWAHGKDQGVRGETSGAGCVDGADFMSPNGDKASWKGSVSARAGGSSEGLRKFMVVCGGAGFDSVHAHWTKYAMESIKYQTIRYCNVDFYFQVTGNQVCRATEIFHGERGTHGGEQGCRGKIRRDDAKTPPGLGG